MRTGHSAPRPEDAYRCGVGATPVDRPYRDLCSTCDHSDACGGRSTPARPIFFCELFEVPVGASPLAAAQATRGAAGGPEDAGLPGGLCVNCANGRQCGLPRPIGGVWHCEEYR